MKSDDDCVTAYMPLFYGDYLKDTGDLDCLEHGAYLQLLAELWTAGGYLPFEPHRLAKRINLRQSQWDGVWSAISRFFDVLPLTETEPPRLSQKRVLYEMEKAREMRRRRSDSGRKAGLASSAARSTVVGKSLNESTDVLPASVNHSPSPSPSEKEREREEGAPPPRTVAVSLPVGFAEFWEVYPRKTGRATAIAKWRQKKPPVDAVMNALAWQKQSRQWRDGVIPNPATWLHGERWLDEPQRAMGVRIAATNTLAAFCLHHRELYPGAPTKLKPGCPECDKAVIAQGASGEPMPGWSE